MTLPILSRLAAPLLAGLMALGLTQPASAGMGDRAGDFDYYALVLSWSPSFCLSGGGSHEGEAQCSTVRPYAFVLHGLWPQFDKGWPESCATGNDPTSVPPDLAKSMLDVMPSEKLVQHEFEKHGTCSGLDMGAYLLMARRLFTSINVPPRYVNLASQLQVPLNQFRNDLLSANRQFSPAMLSVNCDKNGRLVEVHFCYSKEGQPQNCGRNEVQAKECRQDVISMPPVRGKVPGAGATAATAATAAAGAAASNGGSGSFGNDQPAANDPNAGQNAANDNAPDTVTYTRHRHRHHKHHQNYYFSN